MKTVRSSRPPSRTGMAITSEHVIGFILGLVLAALAIDHGLRQPTHELPRAIATTTGP